MRVSVPGQVNEMNGRRYVTPSAEQAFQAARLLQEALALLGAAGIELATPSARSAPDRLLRLPEVEHLSGLRKSAIYEQMQQGSFPRSVKAGLRAAVWSEAAVQAWIATQLEGRSKLARSQA